MDNLPVNTVGLGIAVIVLTILFVVWWPLAVIWSLNTLFQTEIPYSLKTWAAVAVLATILKLATISSEKRKS
jgi:hypothetical protein